MLRIEYGPQGTQCFPGTFSTQDSRVPGVSPAENTGYYRVPRASTAENAEYFGVPGVLRAENTTYFVFW